MFATSCGQVIAHTLDQFLSIFCRNLLLLLDRYLFIEHRSLESFDVLLPDLLVSRKWHHVLLTLRFSVVFQLYVGLKQSIN